ncbi:hypothetical protein RDMS_12175 [Deinococcus sp. RL]|uniref:hypothetical protein n=1 Tax=Deinococcus sp. RL TaxID=1489678 RepID=UPI0004D5CD03|nr:hypothetical protein [Deinococcus sp. RL]KEF33571.1 hypothetical protein RDMS_12175 [Deinococcus sp. RL]
MMGWLGTLLLILAGYGWGTRVSAATSPLPLGWMLALTLGASVLGLALTVGAFLDHQDGPLVTGAVGALAAAVLAVFTAQE